MYLTKSNFLIPISISFFACILIITARNKLSYVNIDIKNQRIFDISVFLLFLVYANTLTGGYNYVSTEILNTIFFSVIFNYFLNCGYLNKYLF